MDRVLDVAQALLGAALNPVTAETMRALAASNAAAHMARAAPLTTTSSTRTTDRPAIREAAITSKARPAGERGPAGSELRVVTPAGPCRSASVSDARSDDELS